MKKKEIKKAVKKMVKMVKTGKKAIKRKFAQWAKVRYGKLTGQVHYCSVHGVEFRYKEAKKATFTWACGLKESQLVAVR